MILIKVITLVIPISFYMKIILGIPDNRIPIWEFKTPIMFNQLKKVERVWENETWVDSGGYQIMKKGVRISVEEVIKRYKEVEGDYFISLDIPTPPCNPPSEESFSNYLKLYEAEINVVPVIHAYPFEWVDKSLDFYKSHPPKVLAYGGVVPPILQKYKGGRLKTIVTYHYLRRKWGGSLHVMGAGSPYMRAVFFNADSVDTSTYRVKAIHGMVIIPGKGEKYVGVREIRWGTKRATNEEIEELLSFLDKTGFPFEVDLESWEGRALINAWVTIKSEYAFTRGDIKKSIEVSRQGEIEDVCANSSPHYRGEVLNSQFL
jgi:hypothetical protein